MFFYIKAMRSWKSIICMTVGSNDKHWQSCMLSILITVPAMFSSHVLCPDCINENIQTFAAFFSYKILLIMNGTKSFLDKYNPKFLNHLIFKKQTFLYLTLFDMRGGWKSPPLKSLLNAYFWCCNDPNNV